MPLGGIGKLAQKARGFAQANPDKVRKALDQAGRLANKRTGGRHGRQIDSAGDKVADFLAPDKPKDPPTSP
jgi:antitoxin protein of toxin-antitoxin system